MERIFAALGHVQWKKERREDSFHSSGDYNKNGSQKFKKNIIFRVYFLIKMLSSCLRGGNLFFPSPFKFHHISMIHPFSFWFLKSTPLSLRRSMQKWLLCFCVMTNRKMLERPSLLLLTAAVSLSLIFDPQSPDSMSPTSLYT